MKSLYKGALIFVIHKDKDGDEKDEIKIYIKYFENKFVCINI